MSPEGIDGNEATAERDMWAFGMTALVFLSYNTLLFLILNFQQELFTAQLPFGNITSRNAIIFHILFGPPDQPACMTGGTSALLAGGWNQACVLTHWIL